MRGGPSNRPSLAEVARSDAALVLGEDVTQTAPMLALALRQSARQAPLKQAAEAARSRRGTPPACATRRRARRGRSSSPRRPRRGSTTSRLAPITPRRTTSRASASPSPHALDSASPPVPGPARRRPRSRRRDRRRAEGRRERRSSSAAAAAAARPCCRRPRTSPGRCERKGRPAQLCLTVAGVQQPGPGAAGRREPGRGVRSGEVRQRDAAIILENDLYRRADAASVDAFLKAAEHVIVVDHTANDDDRESRRRPARGDLRRERRHAREQRRPGAALLPGHTPSRRRAGELALAARPGARRRTPRVRRLGEHSTTSTPRWRRPCPSSRPSPRSRRRPTSASPDSQSRGSPHRYSGRTAMNANLNVTSRRRRKTAIRRSSFSMEGYQGQPPSPLHPALLGARLELGAGAEQVPGGDRRAAARRRPGTQAHRAAGERETAYFGKSPRPSARPAGPLPLRAPRITSSARRS